MPLFIVTVKLPRNPDHNPRAKVTAPCLDGATCTDQTGEHHSYVVMAATLDGARAHGMSRHGHVTRVEATALIPDTVGALLAGRQLLEQLDTHDPALPDEVRAAIARFERLLTVVGP